MLNAPSFLTIHTDRTLVKVAIKVRNPVEVSESVDLTACVNILDKKNAYSYKLTAVINNFGFGTTEGYYTVTLFTDNDELKELKEFQNIYAYHQQIKTRYLKHYQ